MTEIRNISYDGLADALALPTDGSDPGYTGDAFTATGTYKGTGATLEIDDGDLGSFDYHSFTTRTNAIHMDAGTASCGCGWSDISSLIVGVLFPYRPKALPAAGTNETILQTKSGLSTTASQLRIHDDGTLDIRAKSSLTYQSLTALSVDTNYWLAFKTAGSSSAGHIELKIYDANLVLLETVGNFAVSHDTVGLLNQVQFVALNGVEHIIGEIWVDNADYPAMPTTTADNPLSEDDIKLRYSTKAGSQGNSNSSTPAGSLGKYVSTTLAPLVLAPWWGPILADDGVITGEAAFSTIALNGGATVALSTDYAFPGRTQSFRCQIDTEGIGNSGARMELNPPFPWSPSYQNVAPNGHEHWRNFGDAWYFGGQVYVPSYVTGLASGWNNTQQMKVEKYTYTRPTDGEQGTYESDEPVYGGSGGSGEADQQQAQGIYLGSQTTLDYIILALSKVGTPTDDVAVEIRSGATLGASSLLATATLTPAQVPTVGRFIPVTDFDASPTLSASTQYWIVVRRQGSRDVTNYYQVGRADSNVYSPGGSDSMYTRDNNTWSAVTAYDLAFAVATYDDTRQLHHYVDFISDVGGNYRPVLRTKIWPTGYGWNDDPSVPQRDRIIAGSDIAIPIATPFWLESYVERGSKGNFDGRIRHWLDGVLLWDVEGFPVNITHPTRPWEYEWQYGNQLNVGAYQQDFNHYRGNDVAGKQNRYFDNIYVDGSRRGPTTSLGTHGTGPRMIGRRESELWSNVTSNPAQSIRHYVMPGNNRMVIIVVHTKSTSAQGNIAVSSVELGGVNATILTDGTNDARQGFQNGDWSRVEMWGIKESDLPAVGMQWIDVTMGSQVAELCITALQFVDFFQSYTVESVVLAGRTAFVDLGKATLSVSEPNTIMVDGVSINLNGFVWPGGEQARLGHLANAAFTNSTSFRRQAAAGTYDMQWLGSSTTNRVAHVAIAAKAG